MRFNQLRRCPSPWQTAVAVILACVSITPDWAGRDFFRNGAVGGVAIDANGAVSQPTAIFIGKRAQPLITGGNDVAVAAIDGHCAILVRDQENTGSPSDRTGVHRQKETITLRHFRHRLAHFSVARSGTTCL